MPLSSEELQRALGEGRDGWKPLDGETWEAFVRRKAPSAPAFWQPFERADWNRALEEALARGERRETIRALVLPFWIARNEDEVESDEEWRTELLVVSEANDQVLLEIGIDAKKAPCARAELTIVRGSFVTQARSYAPDVAGVRRFGRFAVVESMLRAIALRVEDGDEVTLTPSPARVVPAFSMEYEPAFEGGELHAIARRIAEKQSFDGSE